MPTGVVNCGDAENQLNCSNLCVGDGWFSKITYQGKVNATKICVAQGYSDKIVEYGGNNGKQCKYPGTEYGSPHKNGGPLENLGYTVSWKCSLGKLLINSLFHFLCIPKHYHLIL